MTIPKPNNEVDVPVELGDVHCTCIDSICDTEMSTIKDLYVCALVQAE